MLESLLEPMKRTTVGMPDENDHGFEPLLRFSLSRRAAHGQIVGKQHGKRILMQIVSTPELGNVEPA
jgi:hypothetical protein